MLRLLATGVLITCILASGTASSSGRPRASKEDLTDTANRFLTSWLVRRNIGQALRYVSKSPMLGNCMIPEDLPKEHPFVRTEILNVFRKTMDSTLARTPTARSVSEVLDSSPTISPDDTNVAFVSHSMPNYFQIFQLKTVKDPRDIAYVCKFDERQSFRAAVAQPTVYYLFVKVRGMQSVSPLSVKLLWRKEKAGWRILTMSIGEE